MHYIHPLSCYGELDPQTIIAFSDDGNIGATDCRSNKTAFQMKQRSEKINCYDTLGDYIVPCYNDGTIGLFERRMCSFVMERKFNHYPISCVKCYNKKIVYGNDVGNVLFIDDKHHYLNNLTLCYSQLKRVSSIELNDMMLLSASDDGKLHISYY